MNMSKQWNDKLPIYRQLKEQIVNLILDDALKEGQALPSVRQVAKEQQVNHLTVSKAYHELVDDEIVESRRGLGMYVTTGAKEALLKNQREEFLKNEWPVIKARIERLGLSITELLSFDNKEED